MTSATSRPASRPFSAKSDPTPRIAPRFTCDGENVKSGIFAISQARAIAGNEALLRLSEIWQMTSIPDWQRLQRRVAHLGRAVDWHAHQLEPLALSGIAESLAGPATELTSPGENKRADPASPGQDVADRPGHRSVRIAEVAPVMPAGGPSRTFPPPQRSGRARPRRRPASGRPSGARPATLAWRG